MGGGSKLDGPPKWNDGQGCHAVLRHCNIQLGMDMVAMDTHFSFCMVSRSFKSLVISG